MPENLYTGLVTNIGLMVLIATILTKIPLIKRALSEETHSKLKDQIILAGVFGLFCVFSTCTGVRVNGAIQNTRVIGALVGGLLGGPVVGMGAAIIGAVHRFLYNPHGFTTLSCTISTLFEGVVGSLVWCFFRKKNLKQTKVSLFLITAFAEVCQMLIILAIARPYAEAMALVREIAIPMILGNSCGMVLFFSIFREVFTRQDLLAADKIRLALTIADQSIPYIQKTTRTEEDYEKITEIIRRYTRCLGVLILAADGKTPLNRCDLVVPETLAKSLGEGYYVAVDKEDPNYHTLGKYIAITAKVTTGSELGFYLVLYYSNHLESIAIEQNFVEGLAKFFSTNVEISQIEHQKKLREQAEFRALQSQINPHFLFNSLNTITYFCREKPERARELLLALSVYFRHTLNSSNEYMISIEQELEHVRAYLLLEEARFEERLKVEIEFVENAPYEVPTLILQPIVENAVKHGAMKRESGIVRIHGEVKEDCLWITVQDNGPGMSKEALQAFRDRKIYGKHGLMNVDARLQSIYGKSFALEIRTNKCGTKVTMRIPHKMILDAQEEGRQGKESLR